MKPTHFLKKFLSGESLNVPTKKVSETQPRDGGGAVTGPFVAVFRGGNLEILCGKRRRFLPVLCAQNCSVKPPVFQRSSAVKTSSSCLPVLRNLGVSPPHQRPRASSALFFGPSASKQVNTHTHIQMDQRDNILAHVRTRTHTLSLILSLPFTFAHLLTHVLTFPSLSLLCVRIYVSHVYTQTCVNVVLHAREGQPPLTIKHQHDIGAVALHVWRHHLHLYYLALVRCQQPFAKTVSAKQRNQSNEHKWTVILRTIRLPVFQITNRL